MVTAGNPRREVAAVAAALLLPVPLLAATGVHLPLPAAVERGLASVTPGDGFEIPVPEAVPAHPDSQQAEQSAVGSAQAPSPDGEQASSSAFVGARVPAREVRDTNRPQGGEVEPAEPQLPETAPDDSPREDSPDSSPPESPPAEPDTPPATSAHAEAADLLAVGLDAGGVSTDVEADADEVEVTVSAGDVLPPTALPLPLPLP